MLKLSEIRKRYHKDNGIVKVNLTIEPNHLYLFIGENGSGKSTTIKLISKVIFHSKNDGFIMNHFHKMVYLPDKRAYPKLLRVKTYLRYFLDKSLKEEQIAFYMNRYHLPNKAIGALSKGMLQKLGILQTILLDGDLYLFDEPTDGLDGDSIRIFKEDVKGMLNENKTIIISTHNQTIFKDLKPMIYRFKEGICCEKK
ncbi:MAG: ATP-binding cassette domain-containing protein [Anaeroplasmataceae bacterium]|nr:ATP-binding cassette domain-containing protein [Anaeroplasmataceae bacterium]